MRTMQYILLAIASATCQNEFRQAEWAGEAEDDDRDGSASAVTRTPVKSKMSVTRLLSGELRTVEASPQSSAAALGLLRRGTSSMALDGDADNVDASQDEVALGADSQDVAAASANYIDLSLVKQADNTNRRG